MESRATQPAASTLADPAPAEPGPAAPAADEPLAASAILTHHWLVRMRGGEKVLAALSELLPGAPLYTLLHDPSAVSGRWGRVHASWLQRIPGATRRYPALFPLMPLAAGSMRLPAARLVLCSDAALAKAMRPRPGSLLVCYCHSPMRYVWEPQVQRDYLEALPAPLRPAFRLACALARRVDRRAAARVDHFIANSRHVAERIRRCYGREATVIYPPVDVPPDPPVRPIRPRLAPPADAATGAPAEAATGAPAEAAAGARQGFYLCVGHHSAYKRLDLAVEACRALGRRLVVIGEGPQVERLAARADFVEWRGWQADRVVHDCYRRAIGLLFCGEEDFGIVPVEAQAHGCPVVAYGVGGAAETVTDGRTGVLFAEQTVEAVVEAMRKLEGRTWDPGVLHASALRFRRARFLAQMRACLARLLGKAATCPSAR